MSRYSLFKRSVSLPSTVMCAAILASGGCSDNVVEPSFDCESAIGVIFVDLQPPPSGTFVDYDVDVGDSIQVAGSLRRVDSSAPIFNPQQGWSCSTSASSQVGGTVSFSTLDTMLVRLSPGGWIRGLSQGFALVSATSSNPVASTDLGILVYSP